MTDLIYMFGPEGFLVRVIKVGIRKFSTAAKPKCLHNYFTDDPDH